MKVRAALLLLLLAPLAPGVGFRVATYNVGAHLVIPPNGGAAYFDYGIGNPGAPDHDKVREVLARINADVVSLQEIHSTDVAGAPDDIDALAASLGYSHSYVAPTTNAFDTSLRVVFLSRHPFLSTASVGSPPGAKEITRLCPVVKVDIPGTTRDPVLLGLHLKSGTSSQERFRRAVEMRRVAGYLAAQGITNDDNFILLGDFNPSSTNRTFTALPTGLPTTFVLGSDLTFPITYSTNPLTYFSSNVPTRLSAFQLNGSPSTYDTTTTTGPTLDLMLVSSAIAGRPHATEVYNSTLDTSNSTGLPKSGSPLSSSTSALASDHYAVFADLDLDQDYPNLTASVFPGSLIEGATSNVSVQVNIPAALASPLTVSITPDDPSALSMSASSVVIPAGSTSGSITVTATRDYVAQGARAVTFTVSAVGYDPANAVLQVIDADAPYAFNGPGQTISETFTSFGGGGDPAPWVTSGASWQGLDDGNGALSGLRAYGSGNDGSIGVAGMNAPVIATASFTNDSDLPLTALQVEFTAEQWKAVTSGRPDSLTVELVVNGVPTPLPSLTFTAATHLTTGAIPGGNPVTRGAVITGLFIPAQSTFSLKFTFAPGVGGVPLPAGIFVNEFHYDNAGTDVGEFIEVVVGPGFTGNLSDINIVLYNGSSNPAAAAPYTSSSTFNLATAFAQTSEVTVAGSDIPFRIRVANLPVDGLQNGPNDGIAVINTATSQVLQAIAYEGAFTAGSGPAAGTSFANLPVSQSSAPEAGSSLGKSGSGAVATDFGWATSIGTNSKGLTNSGQTFVLPTGPPQGIALDNLSVTFLADTDQDGLPDLTDPDDDNDGQSDIAEALFGSHPLDASSIYRPSFAITTSGNATLNFATLTGRTYTVQRSETLSDWTTISVHSGTGAVISLPINTTEFPKAFYHVIVSDQ
jgi:endonuclease/exonuclease/phosphatase family metal-dependent hydrolase